MGRCCAIRTWFGSDGGGHHERQGRFRPPVRGVVYELFADDLEDAAREIDAPEKYVPPGIG